MPDNSFRELVEIIRTLRSENGCPWDREQTHQSLRQFLLEETYEVLESLDHNDMASLKEELGDLLLQIVLHAQIASETNHFTIFDVIQFLNDKLIRRHPNVFGEVDIRTAEEQTINWEKLKKKEGRESAIGGVPKSLPALLRAYRIQMKAATVGFDWSNTDDVWEKVDEEIYELREAVRQNQPKKIEEEFGDFLFSLVNLTRFLHINPEDALRGTIEKFTNRFQQIEAELKKRGKSVHSSSLQEMDEIWENVKRRGEI